MPKGDAELVAHQKVIRLIKRFPAGALRGKNVMRGKKKP